MTTKWEYRIRNRDIGGYVVDKGVTHDGGERINGITGFTMPAFLISESRCFDTIEQAKKFIEEDSVVFQVKFEYYNARRELLKDFFNNDGKGFTLRDAEYIADSCRADGMMNVEIVRM